MDESEKKEGTETLPAGGDSAGKAATGATSEASAIAAGPACGVLGGARLEFPVTFDLKIIYVLAGGEGIVEELERIYAGLGVKCALIQGVAAPGAKYGRMGSRLTFQSREQMYAVYEAIGKLPYVKAAI
jgi:putative lipoic acid-binding regulatory protein